MRCRAEAESNGRGKGKQWVNGIKSACSNETKPIKGSPGIAGDQTRTVQLVDRVAGATGDGCDTQCQRRPTGNGGLDQGRQWTGAPGGDDEYIYLWASLNRSRNASNARGRRSLACKVQPGHDDARCDRSGKRILPATLSSEGGKKKRKEGGRRRREVLGKGSQEGRRGGERATLGV